MTFRINCVPPKTTAQGKRLVNIGGKPRFFKSKTAKETERTLEALLVEHQPAEPVLGPVSLIVAVQWPWLTTDSKRVRESSQVPHDRKPDLDNWVKDLVDILVRLRFIEDDAKVVALQVSKSRGNRPGILVTILPW
ncbi:MAG: RusA family crossover junction endodeoxyribonuclease [Fimbriimonadaceae bacterium]|nr:RusA family crossover junction endodeoxyribonuclease [Fimbriimonadaceae bacterium]